MMEVFRLEQPAGDDQLIVLYANRDTGAAIDVGELMREVGEDAARLRVDGWRLVSVGSLPMRESGTAGNVLFQSGGGYATQLTVTAVYSR